MSLTNEQIEARKAKIGGSDIGAILGENKYKTAYEVWEEKIEGKSTDLSQNKSVVIGKLLESDLIDTYERRYNSLCIRPANTFYSEKYEFMSANLDAIAVQDFPENNQLEWQFGEKKIVEIKTASTFNKDEWGPSGSQIVPSSYYAQVAYYMLVSGYNNAEIFVGFIDEKIIGEILCELYAASQESRPQNFSKIVEKMEYRIYRFYRDQELEDLILNSAQMFYNNHMKPWIDSGIKNPPPMDFSNKNFRGYINKKYSISEGSEIKLPNEFVEIKNNYLLATNESKNFERIAQEEKSKILVAMGNNEKALLSDGTYFLRKTIKRKESIVKACEYIKFEFKQPKEIKGEI